MLEGLDVLMLEMRSAFTIRMKRGSAANNSAAYIYKSMRTIEVAMIYSDLSLIYHNPRIQKYASEWLFVHQERREPLIHVSLSHSENQFIIASPSSTLTSV